MQFFNGTDLFINGCYIRLITVNMDLSFTSRNPPADYLTYIGKPVLFFNRKH